MDKDLRKINKLLDDNWTVLKDGDSYIVKFNWEEYLGSYEYVSAIDTEKNNLKKDSSFFRQEKDVINNLNTIQFNEKSEINNIKIDTSLEISDKCKYFSSYTWTNLNNLQENLKKIKTILDDKNLISKAQKDLYQKYSSEIEISTKLEATAKCKFFQGDYEIRKLTEDLKLPVGDDLGKVNTEITNIEKGSYLILETKPYQEGVLSYIKMNNIEDVEKLFTLDSKELEETKSNTK